MTTSNKELTKCLKEIKLKISNNVINV